MSTISLLAIVTDADVALFTIVVVLIFFAFLAYFWWNFLLNSKKNCPSPYSGLPLRRGLDIPSPIRDKIMHYLRNLHQYDNRPFDFNKAAFCRETRRIFIDAVTWYNVIKVDSRFLQKRHPGVYVSWGSLFEEQQRDFLEVHGSLEGFQTEISSPEPSPRSITPEYAFAIPGPLYVDLTSKTVLGWKIIPGTNFELLIVQYPQKKIMYNAAYVEANFPQENKKKKKAEIK